MQVIMMPPMNEDAITLNVQFDQGTVYDDIKVANPFNSVRRSGVIRPLNPETSGRQIPKYPGVARRLFNTIKAG
jgi:hypothetical protein